MKRLWVIFIFGLTHGEKLDRTYLPPVGSATSGGSEGAIDVPLEYPKYSINNNALSKRPEIAIGIDRVGPNQLTDVLEGPSMSNNYYNELLSSTQQPTTTPFIPDDYSTSSPENFGLVNPFVTNGTFQHHSGNNNNIISYGGDINSISGIPSTTELPFDQNVINNDEYGKLDSSTYSPTVNKVDQENKYISSSPPNTPDNEFSTINSQIPLTTPASFLNRDKINYNQKTIETRPERIQAQSDRNAVILNYDQTRTPDGYAYNFDTSNGIHADENGTATDGVKASGSYSYIGDDGKVYSVSYTADENGFLPRGAHLPTSPPIPDAILKVIEIAEKQKEAGIYNDGSYDDKKYGFKRYQGRTGFKQGPIQNGISSNIGDSYLKDVNPNNNYIDIEQQEELRTPTRKYYTDKSKFPVQKEGTFLPSKNRNYNSEETHYKDTINTNPQYTMNIVIENNSENASPGYAKNKKITPLENTEEGYQYFAPESRFNDGDLKSFPSRFSGIDQKSKYQISEEIDKKTTAKPFLTPYVSRKDEDSESNDYDNYKTTKLPHHSVDSEPHDRLFNADKTFDSNNFIRDGNQEYNVQPEDRSNGENPISSNSQGYYYNKNIFTSTIPTEFPSRFTTVQTNNFPASPVSAVNNYGMYTEVPNTYTDESSSGFPTDESTSDFIFNNMNTQYTPTTETTVHYGLDLETPNSKKGIGENFSGSKQNQRFDPNTGYYY